MPTSQTELETSKYVRNQVYLMDLPTHIIIDILSRLPIGSIIRSKCVCRTWHNLICDPEFIKVHSSRSPPGLIVHQTEIFKNYFKIVEFEDEDDHHHIHQDPALKFDFRVLSSYPDADVVFDGSVNGLLCLRDINYKHETLFICNPVAREYITLPRPKGLVRYPTVVTHGFGVSSFTGEYKVVRVVHERVVDPVSGACLQVPKSECHVYRLGTGTAWRCVEDVPVQFVYNSRTIGLFLKGNIHWLIQDLEGLELISCFNLETELFQPFPAPFTAGRGFLGTLGVLKDDLCLCDNTSETDIVIWRMKEYGVKDSWSRDIVIRKIPELAGPTFHVTYAMKVFKDGSILLLWGDFFMLSYCSKNKSTKEVDMNQSRGPNSIEATLHVSSLFSLRNFALENVCKF